VLAHEIAHVAAKDNVQAYAKARFSACRIALSGVNLVAAGSNDVPGGAEFVANSKFSKTMKQFARPGFDLFKDPDVDHDFVRWFLGQQQVMQRLVGPPVELELGADQRAIDLLGAPGYDAAALARVIPLVDTRTAQQRTTALEKLMSEGTFGTKGGKSPAFPRELSWPKG
jgi:predicted Zn-dependent protease